MASRTIKIRGIEPPGLGQVGRDLRLRFWQVVARLGIQQKRREILKGIGADGTPLKPILPATRRYRRSAMTVSGRGDPNAPPLIPGREKSRTFSLLAGRAFSTHCELYWRFDAWTGDNWGTILGYQREAGRDTIGLSAKSIATIKARAWAEWERVKGRETPPEPRQATPAAPVAVPTVGKLDLSHATLGIGRESAEGLTPGTWSGGLTIDELRAHLRSPAEAAIPGLPRRSAIAAPRFNEALVHVWGPGGVSYVAPVPESDPGTIF